MRTFLKISAAALTFAAVPAFAGPTTIDSITVSGPSGTVWNTAVDGYYALFIQHPYGNMLNPNDNFSPAHVFSNASSNYMLTGDGWTTHSSSGPSDPFYNLAVVMSHEGVSQTLTGTFDGATGAFTATAGSATFSGINYTLTEFNWVRGLSNLVGSYSAGSHTYAGQPVGSLADYQGAFTISTAGVPEPATWAMMIFGFGAIAGTMRYRRREALAAA